MKQFYETTHGISRVLGNMDNNYQLDIWLNLEIRTHIFFTWNPGLPLQFLYKLQMLLPPPAAYASLVSSGS